MMTLPKQKIEHLNQTLVMNYNAEKAYLNGYNSSTNLELKKVFRTRAYQHNEFCTDLAIEIKHYGAHVNYSSDSGFESPDFKKMMVSENYKLVFSEINRFNSYCLKHYDTILNRYAFEAPLRELLEEQKQIIGNTMKLTRYMDDFLSVRKNKSQKAIV